MEVACHWAAERAIIISSLTQHPESVDVQIKLRQFWFLWPPTECLSNVVRLLIRRFICKIWNSQGSYHVSPKLFPDGWILYCDSEPSHTALSFKEFSCEKKTAYSPGTHMLPCPCCEGPSETVEEIQELIVVALYSLQESSIWRAPTGGNTLECVCSCKGKLLRRRPLQFRI
jgi:hypothetical protein